MLDLRHNGGGLLNEARARSPRCSCPTGASSRPRAARGRSRSTTPTGGAITSKIPVVVLVDEGSASASEIVTGALQDRKRAKVVGTRTFGKGVFQEIERLSNGGALDITVGEYFTPTGRNLGGGGVRKGARHHAGHQGHRRTRRRRRTRRCRRRCKTVAGELRQSARRRGRSRSAGASAVDAVLRARQPDQRRQAAPAASGVGDLVLVAPGDAAGAARIVRRIGRPDVARDVLDALMVDRGLRRRFDPLVEREARDGRRGARARAGRRDLRDADHVHDRPADGAATSTTRSPPRSSTTARSACGCTSPTSSRVRASPGRRSTARRTGARTRSTCPAWSSRCCPRRCRTAPARWCRARTGWR